MKEKYEISELELKNVIISDDYVLGCQPYEYLFFKIPSSVYGRLKGIELDLVVDSQTAKIVLNEYLPNKPIVIYGSQRVRFDISECEFGENMLAYKGKIRIKEIRFLPAEQSVEEIKEEDKPENIKPEFLKDGNMPTAIQSAAAYLLNSRISHSFVVPVMRFMIILMNVIVCLAGCGAMLLWHMLCSNWKNWKMILGKKQSMKSWRWILVKYF